MTTTAQRPNALTALLAGYISGTVADDVMDRFDDLFEEAPATAEERLAFARFYLDLAATGDVAEAFPTHTEITGILGAVRA
jgi:DNA-binding SARP family transcriptional activator